ncbi:MAG: glycine--tRNA ligase subunit beta [Rhodospirillales bacterium]|nr:glycine--tRNA ligase subunit beta [Rhodospirillales bacterium]
MPELLLELFSEEIPARMQARAAEDLKRLMAERLKAAGLDFTRIDSYVTPRRLALVVDGLPEKQPDVTEEKKGPRVGAPDAAIQGFLKGAGLASLDQCEKRTVGKAEYWFYVDQIAGLPIDRAIAEVLFDTIEKLPWSKSMRWADTTVSWIRPLHNIMAVLDGQQIAFDFDLRHVVEGDRKTLVANNRTRGHRFMSSNEFAVKNFADYKAKLEAAKVILDPAERRAAILRQAEAAAKGEGLTLKEDAGLLDEVTGLVEWPRVLVGSIDAAYMALPPEVLTTSMRAHQKYFALLNKNGALAPRFLVVSNMETDADGRRNIVAGNERVLRARLSDAKFFWDQDRKTRLEDRVPALAAQVFHAKLGTLGDKVSRMETLAGDLAQHIPGCDKDRARSAARLAKADLSSGMVGEFPELQGVMGRYYALAEGEKADVADAIRDHYSPIGPNDRCPSAPVSVAAALADKIDTLVGFFGIRELPTGSKDPFALRRAALGVIRLIVENKLRLPLLKVFATGIDLYNGQAKVMFTADSAADRPLGGIAPEIGAELLSFFADRLKVALREKGVRHDLVDAVFALGGEDDLVRLLARVDALGNFLGNDDGANLLVAYRRASNIVAIEEKKDKTAYNGAVATARFVEPEETGLHAALGAAQDATKTALGRQDFVAAMQTLAALRRPIDAFFDKVTVNAPDVKLRENRLRLLSEIRRTLAQVADFSKIEG